MIETKKRRRKSKGLKWKVDRRSETVRKKISNVQTKHGLTFQSWKSRCCNKRIFSRFSHCLRFTRREEALMIYSHEIWITWDLKVVPCFFWEQATHKTPHHFSFPHLSGLAGHSTTTSSHLSSPEFSTNVRNLCLEVGVKHFLSWKYWCCTISFR